MKTVVTDKGQLITPTMRKYKAIIESGKIEEREIISMRSFMHKSKENADFILLAFYDNDKPLTLSPEQNQKGYDFLMNQWKTSSGRERKNNPFGYREQKVLDNFSHFELKELYNVGNLNHDFYLPMYECISKDGNSFEYYYNGTDGVVIMG